MNKLQTFIFCLNSREENNAIIKKRKKKIEKLSKKFNISKGGVIRKIIDEYEYCACGNHAEHTGKHYPHKIEIL